MDNLLKHFQWLNNNYPLPGHEHLIPEYQKRQDGVLAGVIAMHQRVNMLDFIQSLDVRDEIKQVFTNRIKSDTCGFCRGNNLSFSHSTGEATCRDCK